MFDLYSAGLVQYIDNRIMTRRLNIFIFTQTWPKIFGSCTNCLFDILCLFLWYSEGHLCSLNDIQNFLLVNKSNLCLQSVFTVC